MDFKTPCFKHQLECFEKIKDQPYYALLLEPGLGKTKVTLDIISYRKIANPNYKTLVICPNTLVENWVEEAFKHSDLVPIALLGTKDKRLKNLASDADVYVINYESTRILKNDLIKKGFDLLVLDESTAVKNPKTLQSKACFEISYNTKGKLILTGTPIMNNPLDIFGQYRILNPDIYGRNFYRFRSRYAMMGGYLDKQVVRWINMVDFRQRLYRCAVRKTKDDCLDLPDKLYQVIRLDVPEEQKKVYNDLKTGFMAEFREGLILAPVVLTRLMRFSQITAGFTKTVEGEEYAFSKNPKIDWLIDFVKNLAIERKVVVFCRFSYEIKMVEAALRKANLDFVTVQGGVKDRIDLVNKFNRDASVRCFIGQIQTTGMGINLTSANYAVFMSNSYSYGERVQAEDRIHRIGQDRNCTYIDLLLKGTVDVSIHNTLKRKESLSTLATSKLVEMV